MGPRATIQRVRGSGAAVLHAPARDRAAIVGLRFGTRRRDAAEGSLDELAGLAAAAGATVSFRTLQERSKPDPACFLGRGKVRQLAAACGELDIGLVVVDAELTPGQSRNLEKEIGQRVVDRTQLILDIFASRARTREGRLQVELAQLRYLLPRLAGVGAALSRLGAGIGTRGPGETKLETDRRRIRQRIERLTRDLESVRSRRLRLRERRRKRSTPTLALVGYTNAGKSSLFNRLTDGEAPSSDALFVTLDPLVRPLRLPDRRTVLVADTVGFIDRLPHHPRGGVPGHAGGGGGGRSPPARDRRQPPGPGRARRRGRSGARRGRRRGPRDTARFQQERPHRCRECASPA